MPSDIVAINRPKRFSLKEARELLPIVRKITDEAVKQFTVLQQRIEDLDPAPEQQPVYQAALEEIVRRWGDKIVKLGGEMKGLWLVDFDTGEGYLCWKYPEESLDYFHSYEAGFSGRTPIL